ncbi:MAG: tyrosine-type recombinase/integrase [Alphaproteobacteria bacterium]|nr:tyrosine-type recombinase/integrase [Alphaproteobacteria bacterium]
MLPHCSHIALKRGVYFFRRRVPGDRGAEVTISLRTRSFREAQWLAASLSSSFDRMVRELGDDPNISEIVRAFLKRQLDFDLAHRASSNGKGIYPPYELREDDLKFLDAEIASARIELRDRLYDHQGPLIDEIMEKYTVPTHLRQVLAHGILRARLEALEIIRERTLSDSSSLLRDDERAEVIAPLSRKAEPALKAPDNLGPMLSAVLPDFLTAMTEDVGWSGQTRAQNEATYELFLRVCGDEAIISYERRHLGDFYNLLRRLPALYAKSPAYRGKSVTEIVQLGESQGAERLAMRTIKRHFAALHRLFGYLKRQGLYSAENPAADFEFPTQGRANQKRKMWEGEALTKLFSSPVWAGCKSKDRRSIAGSEVIFDERYWLPILGLFHGNRLEEFAQLRRGDVRQEAGVWFFDIHDEGERQLKNEQSQRRVPVHPKVLELNFVDYVKSISHAPEALLFPDLTPGGPDKKLGYHFTKWWTTYRRKVGVYEKGLDYHSFRHGVTTKLYGADVSEPLVDELTGHEGQSTSRRVYKKDLPLRMLYEAISKVSWPEVEGLLSKFGSPLERD